MDIAFISHPDCARHIIENDHPECPARLSAINDELIVSRLDTLLRHYEAPLVDIEQLNRVHDPKYTEAIFQKSPGESDPPVWLTGDTAMNAYTLDAARRAAGAVVHAVDLVMQNTVSKAFCSVRPPGHHATRNASMGFCFFNNIAVGAAHALAAWNLKRVAIVDFDVHHGNGTEDIFKGQASVLVCSSFQHPFYPHSNPESAHENIINIPLPAGTTGGELSGEIESRCFKPLKEFKPELIMISAGFDAHVQDDMADFQLVEQDYIWLTQEIRQIAEQCCNGRIVSVLEGGYALPALGRSVAAHINAFL